MWPKIATLCTLPDFMCEIVNYFLRNMDTFIQVLLAISVLSQVHAAPRQPRLSLAEYEETIPNNYYYNNIDGTPMYSFGYDVSDPVTGNTQYRSEERHLNGTVSGSYGYIDPYGQPRKYRYVADHLGYRVFPDVTTMRPFPMTITGSEPTVTWTRPPRPNKKKVFTDLVTKLGTFFANNNFV